MFVTFRVGSLLRLLAATAVVAAVIGILVAGRNNPGTPGPGMAPPTTTVPPTTQDLAPLGGVQARP
jgi:hypothetical protein